MVLLRTFLPIFIQLILYFFSEFYTGKSLGKLITGTKVISLEEKPFTAKQILIRTFSRIVPFESLSLLFSFQPWHDDWSNTAVVNKDFPEWQNPFVI